MLTASECGRLWSAACAQGLVTTNREEVRDTEKAGALEPFCSAEGSTMYTAVTRPLLPFVKGGSPYFRMRKTAARETLQALQNVALAKHLWIQDDCDAAITMGMYSSAGLTAAATDK